MRLGCLPPVRYDPGGEVTFPLPLVLAWACYNAFVAIRAAAVPDAESIVAMMLVLIIGILSTLLLSFGYIEAFGYYELGVFVLHIGISQYALSPEDRRSILVGALGRGYLATGVWLLS